jgi:hypothetical protein
MRKYGKLIMNSAIIPFLLTSVSFSQSQFPNPSTTINNRKATQPNLPPKKLDIQATILFSDLKLYQLLDIKKHNFLFILKRLNNLYIAYYPQLKFLLPSIEITTHPEFITKVIFDKYKIKKVISSSKDFKMLSYTENILMLQPTKNLIVANLEVFLQNTENLNDRKIVEIMVEKLNPNVERNRVLYTSYLIVKPKVLTPLQVLEYYKARYGEYPQNDETVNIGGITYKIEYNPSEPNVSIGNNDYKIYSLTIY